jgi:site-specific DNA-methyltransferase (adenine-specific)
MTIPRSKYQIFPPHPPDRQEALDHSVVDQGVQRATIWDHEGNLLDGWELEVICEKRGLRCPREVRHFESEADKFRFILAVNAHRRPCLSSKQKRSVIEAYLRGDPEIADNTLAVALGVSKNTVLKARRRLEATGTIKQVTKTKGKDGKVRPVKYTKRIITNSAGEFERAKEVVQHLPDNCAGKTLDITTASRRARRNQKKEERQGQVVTPLADEDIRLFHCRFQELEQVAGLNPASAQLFVADIPYGGAFLPQVDDLGKLAGRMLVEGGLLAVYVGQAYLNRVMGTFDKHLTYRWTLASVWDGDATIFHLLQVLSQCKPILLYSKGEWKQRGLWPDVLRVNSKEKDVHEWQQPLEEAERLVRYFSQPGDLVVDPCGGGFTTAEACLRLSRKCVSCDLDPECVGKGQDRINKARLSAQAAGSPLEGANPGVDDIRIASLLAGKEV